MFHVTAASFHKAGFPLSLGLQSYLTTSPLPKAATCKTEGDGQVVGLRGEELGPGHHEPHPKCVCVCMLRR